MAHHTSGLVYRDPTEFPKPAALTSTGNPIKRGHKMQCNRKQYLGEKMALHMGHWIWTEDEGIRKFRQWSNNSVSPASLPSDSPSGEDQRLWRRQVRHYFLDSENTFFSGLQVYFFFPYSVEPASSSAPIRIKKIMSHLAAPKSLILPTWRVTWP